MKFFKRTEELDARGPREYYPLDDECGNLPPETFREADINPELRDKLRAMIFEVFFGTPEERAIYGSHIFHELPPAVVERMPEHLRAEYLGELAVARDPRWGGLVKPYQEPDNE